PVPTPAHPAPATPAASMAVETEAPVERPLTGRAVFTASEPTYTQYTPPHASPSEAMPARPASPAMDSGAPASSPYAAPRADVGGYAGTPVHEGHVVYAGFWKRVAASIIDAFAIGIPVGIVAAIVGGLLGFGSSFAGGLSGAADVLNPGETITSYLLTAIAYAWFHSTAGLTATPGKLAIGIKVVRTDGERISFLRGFARYWAYLLSGLLLAIGLIMAAFTARKQGLHDLICDTLVVDKWAFTSQPERQRDELGTVALVVLIIFGVLLVGAFILMAVGFAALASMGR
ncbi:MAG TPA: RDD family protein, partial [Pseudoxanthomonas sp.]